MKNKQRVAEPSAERPMRVEEAADYTSIGVSWIRKLIKTGRLPAIRTGAHRYYLINRCDLDACLENMKT
jgi:excisionase family DNA binding protein